MACDCIDIRLYNGPGYGVANLTTPTGTFLNGQPYWQFELYNPPPPDGDGLPTGLYFELSQVNGSGSWKIYSIPSIPSTPNTGTELLDSNFKPAPDCPSDLSLGTWTIINPGLTDALTTDCSCTIYQNRTKKEYTSIKLPEIFEEEDRGYFRCCCEAIVLADLVSSDTWKNDITSAWIKLSSVLDTVSFDLYKDNTLAIYQPSQVTFARESLGRYVTIPWQTVLNTDGAGCYRLDITFTIAGVNQTFTWGKYKLKPYSIQNALETARVRAIFNAYNEIEQIDFRDSKVVDTLRFYGFIGNAQPNMEIDNIIYDNREMKKVIRENLNTYEIITDPICEEFTKSLKDLYLLSENELFISDYNAHNHSYRYQDLPVIVTESPEIEYYDFSREAKLTCTVGDKFKNKRSYYK